MDGEVVFDSFFELPGTSVSTPPDLFLGKSGEPSLYHVEPGRSRRCKMDMIPKPLRKPSTNSWRFVSPVIVQDQILEWDEFIMLPPL